MDTGTTSGAVVAAAVARTRRRPPAVWVDFLLCTFVGAVVAAFGWWFARAVATQVRVETIDLSVKALPGYALLSFVRVSLSYVLSLIYTVVYGTIAAKNARAERVMIPLLDVLQGIPVLGFLPGFGLAMIGLFPRSNMGIELTTILMIFTAMPWNMAYSYYSSLRTMPQELSEVARVHRLNWFQRFLRLELPIALNGLVWNSMMSMAGGWFFLMVIEAFSLRVDETRVDEFVVPGIGSYMSHAYDAGNWWAVGWALGIMSVVVIVSDQLIWKPVVAWAARYRLDDEGGAATHRSWLEALLARSWLVQHLLAKRARPAPPAPSGTTSALRRLAPPPQPRPPAAIWSHLGRLARGVALLGVLAFVVWGGLKLVGLVRQVGLSRWGEIGIALVLTTLRHFAAVVVGALLMIPPGVAIGLSPRLARRAQPIVQVVASFPAPMFFPLITAWLVRFLGKDSFEWTCIVLTLFGTQWYVLFNVIAGATAIPSDLQEAARVYRLTGARRWRQLLIPGIVPQLVTGLFTAAGGAWNGAIVAEYQHLEGQTVQVHGLGAMISEATDRGDYPTLAASVVALVLTIVLLNRFLWTPIHRRSEERYAVT